MLKDKIDKMEIDKKKQNIELLHLQKSINQFNPMTSNLIDCAIYNRYMDAIHRKEICNKS